MFDTSNFAFNPHAIPILIIGVFTLGLGSFAFASHRAAAANRHFLVLCISIGVWLLATGAGLSSRDPEQALRWFKLDNIGVMYISVSFYAFSAEFLELRRPRSIRLGYALASLNSLAILLTDGFVVGVQNYWWGYYPRWGLFCIPFFPVFFGYMAGAFAAYSRSLQKGAPPLRHKQIKHVFIAFLIAYTGSVDFLPVFGYEVYPFGYIPIFVLVSVISYTILRYRLMDFSTVLEKILTYLLLLFIFSIPSYGLLLVAQKAYFGTISSQFSLIFLLVFALIVAGAYQMKNWTQTAIARTLFRSRYDMYETLSKFSKALVTILDLKALTEEIVQTLVSIMGIQAASLYILDKEKDIYILVSSHGLPTDQEKAATFTVMDELPYHLTRFQSILVLHELEDGPDARKLQSLAGILRALRTEVCLPLVNKNRLIGFCNLGARTSHRIYSDQDLRLLTTLAQEAAIALDNAVLYEDLKRSQILVQRTDRLRSLETIAEGFAHEVRNPLTSIKTFIQLAPARKEDPDFLGRFSLVVSEDVTRIERLIQEIFDYARYMKPKFKEEDLNNIVESCLYIMEINTANKAVQFDKDLTPDLPPVMVDRQQIKQILLNLFLNALEALHGQGGLLTVKTHRLNKATGDPWVQMEVTDSGPGISPADLEHIFDPFFTTKHASTEREGTGLGLTIVHQIVQEHSGYIEVASEAGKGTTFLVNLPVNPRQFVEKKWPHIG